MKYVSPSVQETAFSCPHCGALAKQFWCSLHAIRFPNDKSLPQIISPDNLKLFNLEDIEDVAKREKLNQLFDKLANGRPFLEENEGRRFVLFNLHNTFVSRCFNCEDVSIWIYDKMIYPQRGEAPPANPDLSDDIRRDYDEASSILDLSPRGAAALIRLAIQKLCKELGQPGEVLNADIGALVEKGLDPLVQKALDAVRVIGNNAVHPGHIDLKDDRQVAESQFQLLNLIAEKMISVPKHVDEVYAGLPDGARKAIEKRDANG